MSRRELRSLGELASATNQTGARTRGQRERDQQRVPRIEEEHSSAMQPLASIPRSRQHHHQDHGQQAPPAQPLPSAQLASQRGVEGAAEDVGVPAAADGPGRASQLVQDIPPPLQALSRAPGPSVIGAQQHNGQQYQPQQPNAARSVMQPRALFGEELLPLGNQSVSLRATPLPRSVVEGASQLRHQPHQHQPQASQQHHQRQQLRRQAQREDSARGRHAPTLPSIPASLGELLSPASQRQRRQDRDAQRNRHYEGESPTKSMEDRCDWETAVQELARRVEASGRAFHIRAKGDGYLVTISNYVLAPDAQQVHEVACWDRQQGYFELSYCVTENQLRRKGLPTIVREISSKFALDDPRQEDLMKAVFHMLDHMPLPNWQQMCALESRGGASQPQGPLAPLPLVTQPPAPQHQLPAVAYQLGGPSTGQVPPRSLPQTQPLQGRLREVAQTCVDIALQDITQALSIACEASVDLLAKKDQWMSKYSKVETDFVKATEAVFRECGIATHDNLGERPFCPVTLVQWHKVATSHLRAFLRGISEGPEAVEAHVKAGQHLARVDAQLRQDSSVQGSLATGIIAAAKQYNLIMLPAVEEVVMRTACNMEKESRKEARAARRPMDPPKEERWERTRRGSPKARRSSSPSHRSPRASPPRRSASLPPTRGPQPSYKKGLFTAEDGRLAKAFNEDCRRLPPFQKICMRAVTNNECPWETANGLPPTRPEKPSSNLAPSAGGMVPPKQATHPWLREDLQDATSYAARPALWEPVFDLEQDSLLPPPPTPAQKPALMPGSAAWKDPASWPKGWHPQRWQQLPGDQLSKYLEVVHQLCPSLQLIGTKDAVDHTPDHQWLEHLRGMMHNDNDFTAGLPQLHYQVWERYFELTKEGATVSGDARRVLSILKYGYRFKFVGTDHPSQREQADRDKKVRIVKQMLKHSTQGRGRRKAWVDSMLQGDTPHHVIFPNHASTEQYSQFTMEEIGKGLAAGYMVQWPEGTLPTVVNGLKVEDSQHPKLRLCINPMYPNLFMEHNRVRYEKLQDIADLARPGDEIYTTDDKAGFYHIPIHPDHWQFLGFSFKGKYYAFTHLPFGVAPGPWLYTLVKQEVFKPLRRAGVRMAFLIDDQAGLATGHSAAKFQAALVVMLLVALGFFVSRPKAQLPPGPEGKFLGMIADLAKQEFRVPQQKAEKFLQLAAETLQAAQISNRQVAVLAGKMMAMSPAIHLSPLAARAIHQAMVGRLGWDEAFASTEEFRRHVELACTLLKHSNGRKWRKLARALPPLLLAGDASETATAAFTPGGELGAPIKVDFTPQQVARARSGEFSSTEREVLAIYHAIAVAVEHHPEIIVGRAVTYETDNQGAVVDVMAMKGSRAILPVVRDLLLLCAQQDIDLSVVWKPRETDNQRVADYLSKLEDNSEWTLNQEVYEGLLQARVGEGKQLATGGRLPTIDIFASSTVTKVPASFYSMHYCPGTKGVDAFKHPWAKDVATGARHYAYINGPFDRMGEIVDKIYQEQVDCILVAPYWIRPWTAVLRQLPVVHQLTLPHRPDLCIPGEHVPNSKKRNPKHPRYAVKAYYITWPAVTQ